MIQVECNDTDCGTSPCPTNSEVEDTINHKALFPLESIEYVATAFLIIMVSFPSINNSLFSQMQQELEEEVQFYPSLCFMDSQQPRL